MYFFFQIGMLNNMNTKYIIALSALAILIGVSGYMAGKVQEGDSGPKWLTYTNEEYGFEFQYPPNSIIEPRQDLNYQYIRLQNYSPTNSRIGLAVDEYYLEIFIFDEKLGHKPWQSCEQSVVNPRKVDLGTITGYRGFGEVGGDAGGIRFALCVKRPSVQFYIQGTENDEKASLVNQIFDSFKFTN